MHNERTVWRRLSRLGTSLAVAGAAVISVAGLGVLTDAPAGAAATTLNVVFNVPVFGGYGQQSVTITGAAPATATQGSSFTSTFTPAPQTVPTTDAVGSITATVGSIQGIATIIPLPANSTFVSASASGPATWTGPSTGSLPLTVTECTASGQTGCTGTPNGGGASGSFNGNTTLPYLELATPGAVSSGTSVTATPADEIPAGASLTFPTVTVVLTASGAAGSTIQPALSEFQTTANVTSPLTLSSAIYAWPAAVLTSAQEASGQPLPAPLVTPLATTTITAATTVPGAPTIGTATAGNASATVNWTAPASNGGSAITGYVITPSSGSPVTVGNVTSDTLTGLTNGTAYTFKVAAINAIGTGAQSAASNSVTPVAPATVPGAPTIGTATAGNASATVTWTAPASNGGSAITGYVITPSSGSPVTVGNVTTDTLTGLTNGTAYTFKVAAINAVGTGAPSAASNSVTPTAPTVTVPGAPTIGTATAGNGQATVTWSAPASNGGSAITGYVITPSTGSPVTVGNVTSATLTGLTNGTAYTFKVAAINAVGTGAPSAASNSVTPTASNACTGLPAWLVFLLHYFFHIC